MLFKNSFLLPHLFCNVEFEVNYFTIPNQSSEVLILKADAASGPKYNKQ